MGPGWRWLWLWRRVYLPGPSRPVGAQGSLPCSTLGSCCELQGQEGTVSCLPATLLSSLLLALGCGVQGAGRAWFPAPVSTEGPGTWYLLRYCTGPRHLVPLPALPQAFVALEALGLVAGRALRTSPPAPAPPCALPELRPAQGFPPCLDPSYKPERPLPACSVCPGEGSATVTMLNFVLPEHLKCG